MEISQQDTRCIGGAEGTNEDGGGGGGGGGGHQSSTSWHCEVNYKALPSDNFIWYRIIYNTE